MSIPRPTLVHVTAIPFTLWVFLRGQSLFLKERGFEVHAATSTGPFLDEFARATAIPTRTLPIRRGLSPLADVRAILQLAVWLRRLRPHVVHAHTPKGGLVGMLAARLARIPLRIYHLHGLRYATCDGWRRRMIRRGEMASCGLAHRVIAVGSSLREAALRNGLCPEEKIAVLAHGSIGGVDAERQFHAARFSRAERARVRDRWQIPAEARVVGFVGRIVRDKGVVELASAWHGLRQRHPEAHLLLVGPMERVDPVPPAVLSTLRSDPRVHFTGPVGDTSPLYSVMDLVVLPTYREGFPVVPLEAAAMGLPVVGTRCVGCVDAIEDGVTGTLVPVGSSTELAAAIAGYLGDAGLRARHGAAGRARVLAHYRPEDVWQAMYEEYRSLLARFGPQER